MLSISNCSVYSLYNWIFTDTTNALLIDLRSTENFNQLHIINAINITNRLLNGGHLVEFVKSQRGGLLSISTIYVYGIGNNNKNNQAVYDKLIKQLSLTNLSNLYILDVEFETFQRKFPFLCTNKCKMQNIATYPSQIINDRLYVGAAKCATNKKILKNLGITHILNVTISIPCIYQNDKDLNIKYLQIFADDHVNEDISVYFEQAISFIHNAINDNDKNRILVHCEKGVSRSPSFVIAYLMKYHTNNHSFFSAEEFVKQKRNIIKPNAGFETRLYEFQHALQNNSKSSNNDAIYKYAALIIGIIAAITCCYHISSKL